MKIKLFFIFSLIIVCGASMLVLGKDLNGSYGDFWDLGDEINYLTFVGESSQLISQKGMACFYEITQQKFDSWTISNIDMPAAMFYLLGIRLYPKYKEDLFRLAEGNCWYDWALTREENFKILPRVTQEMLFSARSLSLAAGVLGCLMLFLTLWSIGVRAGALIAALLLLLSSIYQIYSVHICPEIFFVSFSSLSLFFFLCFYRALLGNRKSWLIFASLSAVFSGIAAITKLSAGIPISYIIIFSLVLAVIRSRSSPPQRIAPLMTFVCATLFSVFIFFYLSNPYIMSHPLSGWAEMLQRRIFLAEGQVAQFACPQLPLPERLINIPARMLSFTVPADLNGGIYLSFVLGQGIFFLAGMARGLKGLKQINLPGLSGNYFILSGLWLFTGLWLLGLLFVIICDWPRYYLLIIYLYFIIVGVGIGEIEKRLFPGRLRPLP